MAPESLVESLPVGSLPRVLSDQSTCRPGTLGVIVVRKVVKRSGRISAVAGLSSTLSGCRLTVTSRQSTRVGSYRGLPSQAVTIVVCALVIVAGAVKRPLSSIVPGPAPGPKMYHFVGMLLVKRWTPFGYSVTWRGLTLRKVVGVLWVAAISQASFGKVVGQNTSGPPGA